MTLSRRARELVWVAIFLALPILVLRSNLKAPSELNPVDRALLRLSSPLEAAMTALLRTVRTTWSRYIDLVHLSEENERLRQDNGRLRTELATTHEEAARGARLGELLHLRATLRPPARGAHVIGLEISPLFRVGRIRIDVGARPAEAIARLLGGLVTPAGDDFEVKPGMAVLGIGGVVGRVQRVFGSYADVLLAADPKSSIDVVVARTQGRGVVKGIAGDNRYRMRVDYLLRQDEVAVGDLVVTSGLGGSFPRYLPVGKIVKVVKHDVGLYQEAEVEPTVDFSKLSDVVVVGTAP